MRVSGVEGRGQGDYGRQGWCDAHRDDGVSKERTNGGGRIGSRSGEGKVRLLTR